MNIANEVDKVISKLDDKLKRKNKKVGDKNNVSGIRSGFPKIDSAIDGLNLGI